MWRRTSTAPPPNRSPRHWCRPRDRPIDRTGQCTPAHARSLAEPSALRLTNWPTTPYTPTTAPWPGSISSLRPAYCCTRVPARRGSGALSRAASSCLPRVRPRCRCTLPWCQLPACREPPPNNAAELRPVCLARAWPPQRWRVLCARPVEFPAARAALWRSRRDGRSRVRNHRLRSTLPGPESVVWGTAPVFRFVPHLFLTAPCRLQESTQSPT